MKADFYTGYGSNSEWLGSLLKNGSPWYIPLEVLIQVNKIMFEENTLEFLRKNDGYIRDDHDPWPHEWEDSQLTDYVYIFNPHHGKVYLYQPSNDYLLDPVKIVQGYSIIDSFTGLETPQFPKMKLKVKASG